jgi:thioredoxin-related protein
MKTLKILLAILVTAQITLAQEVSKDVSENVWFTHIDSAKREAAKTNKPILLVFSGSDWCKPCIMLKRNIFESEAFSHFAKSDLILLKADFPSKKANKLGKEQIKHNELLAEKFNRKGTFPRLVLMSEKGEVLATYGYDNSKTAEDYIDQIKKRINHDSL